MLNPAAPEYRGVDRLFVESFVSLPLCSTEEDARGGRWTHGTVENVSRVEGAMERVEVLHLLLDYIVGVKLYS